jgi:hypothetical protein
MVFARLKILKLQIKNQAFYHFLPYRRAFDNPK